MLRETYIEALLDQLEADNFYRDNIFKLTQKFRMQKPKIDIPNEGSIFLIDIFCQRPRGSVIDLFDWINASNLWSNILCGELKYRFLSTSDIPQKDSDTEGNNNILKELVKTSPEQIKNAEFWGGKFGSDGFIEFFSPPINEITNFPLEVGSCRTDQLITHLGENHGFARMPY